MTVLQGDALTVMQAIASESVDAVVTDPPYAIRLSRGSRQPRPASNGGQNAQPGARLEVEPVADAQASRERRDEVEKFAAATMLGQQSSNWKERATHSRGYADNDPGAFQLWCSLWAVECLRVLKPGGHLVAFGGTRTWHRLTVAVEDCGFEIRDSLAWLYATGFPKSVDGSRAVLQAGGTAEDADSWEGWGTALRPAFEPIVLARKPLEGTVGRNLLEHGTGGLDIDGCRLGARHPESVDGVHRWPSNVFLDRNQASTLDIETGDTRPSRFFWVAKPSQRERVAVGETAHPTVKPLSLMRELVRLVTPPDGIVLDPFAGSGTTVEACLVERRGCLAIERESTYLSLINARVSRRVYGLDVNHRNGSMLTDDTDGHPDGSDDAAVAGLF